MDELFRVRITVDTDGDFIYDRDTCPEEKDFESFEEAYGHLVDFLRNLTKTIVSSRPYVKKSVILSIEKAIELYTDESYMDENSIYLDNSGITDGTIDMGNQEIYWSIESVH